MRPRRAASVPPALPLAALVLLLSSCRLGVPGSDFVCRDDADCAALAGYRCGAEGKCARAAPHDGGAPAEDAGVPPPVDAGPPDAGPTPTDDAGVTPDDAGAPPPPDAGPAPPDDAGAPDDDAGTAACAAIDSATMTCAPSGGLAATCTVTLEDDDDDPVAAAAACLDCRVGLRRQRLFLTDFGDDSGCDLDGWFVASSGCYANGYNCGTFGSTGCCDDVSSFCTDELGGRVVRADTDCAGGEVRLRRNVDLRGYVGARLCFDAGDTGATLYDVIEVRVSDTLTFADDDTCRAGAQGDGGELARRCLDLPAFTDDNAHVQLELIVHSSLGDDALYLDNVELLAAPAACAPEPVTLLDDALVGCAPGDAPLVVGNGWDVTQGSVRCEDWDCPDDDSVIATAEDTVLERRVSTLGVDGTLDVCFTYGDRWAGFGEGLELLFDVGDGYERAFAIDDTNLASDETCDHVQGDAPRCVRLSDLDARALEHPSLGLRFRLFSGGELVGLDHVTVRGTRLCDDAASGLSLAAPVDVGQGRYDVVVSSTAAADARVTCSVDGAPLAASRDVLLAP